MPNPFAPYQGGGNSGAGGAFSAYLPKAPSPTKKKKKGPTREQIRMLVEALERDDAVAFRYLSAELELTPRQQEIIFAAVRKPKNESLGGTLKDIGKGAVGGATWALDKLMRPSWAVSAAVSEALGGESDTKANNVFGAALSGLKGETRKGFGEILKEQNMMSQHPWTRAGIGFGLDVLTDPLMALSIAAAPVTGGSSVAAYTAAKASAKGVSKPILEKAAREAGERVLKGEVDDTLEEILTHAGTNYQHRLGLLKQYKTQQQKPVIQLGHEQARAFNREIHVGEAMARAEARVFDPRKIQLILGTRKHGITVNSRIPAISRPGAKLAMKDLPIISQLSDKAGRAFIPGFKNDIFRAGEMARQHAGEYNALLQRDAAMRIFKGFDVDNTDPDLMVDALHFMEQPLKRGKSRWQAVVKDKGGDGFVLNQKYLDKLQADGLIDDVQRDFIERFHQTTEYLNRADNAAGVAYKNFEESGRMYVPHVVRDGVDKNNVIQTSLTTRAGFEHGRTAEMSLAQIRDAIKKGDMEDLFELDPMKALARRSRAGAERQADMALINTLISSIGQPTRVVDEKLLGRSTARLLAAGEKHEAAVRVAASMEEAYEKKVAAITSELEQVHEEARSVIAKRIRETRKSEKAKAVSKLEKQIEKLKVAPKVTYGVRKKGKGYEFYSKVGKKITVEGERRLKREADAAVKELEKTRARIKFKPDESKIKQLEGELKKLKKQKYTNEAIEKAEAALDNLGLDFDKAIKAATNPRSRVHKKAVIEELNALKTAKATALDAKKELAAARKAVRAAQAGKRNKLPKDYIPISALGDEFGNAWAFPKEARESIFRLRRLISGDDKTVDDFARGVGKWMGAWKVLVTTVNPGYRFRNTMTDGWNMWVAGVPSWAMGSYGVKAARMMRAVKDPSHPNFVQAFKYVHEASDHGIMSGLFAGDIQSVAQMLKHADATKLGLAKRGKLAAATTKLAQDLNRNAENWGRLTHYLYRRQNLGESAAEAAFRTKIAHFDYEDLTDFEQRVMKKLFPFYTWTRKNIPYQARQIMAEPGRYSAFPKLAQEAEYAAVGEGEGGPAPEFVSEAFGMRIGPDRFMLPQFGVSDLEVFQGPDEAAQRFFAQLNPAVKLPMELWLNKNSFTRAPIESERHPRNPVTGLGEDILSLIPGSNVGQTARTGPGLERLTGPGADPQLVHLVSQIPWLRTALVSGGGIRGQQNDRAAILSQLAGISTTTGDPDLNAYYERLSVEDKVDKMIQGYRDAGRIPLTTRTQTDFDKLIMDILKGNY